MALAKGPSVSSEATELGYEPTDASPRGLAWFVVAFIGTAMVVHVALWYLLLGYLGLKRPAAAPQSIVRAQAPPAGPPLQPSPDHNYIPEIDLARMRQADLVMFRAIGWHVNDATGEPMVPPQIVRQLQQGSSTRPTTGRGGAP